MKRREFVSLIGAAMVWPTAAFAQQRSAPKIGFLYTGSQQAGAPRLEAFLSGLRTVGVSASAQIEIVFRTTDGDPSRIIPLMEEIVRQNPDAIFANGPAVVQAARATTQRIPILALDLETDPVGNGFAASIAHPGGNVSGLFFDFPNFSEKWLELLRETNSNLSKVAVLWDPIAGPTQRTAVEQVARSLNINLEVLEVRSQSDFYEAFVTAKQRSAEAMILLSSPLISPNVQKLAELAMTHRLPAITLFPDFARAGGLLAYGPNLLDMYRQVGVMAGKVLQGTSPAELPIERPTKFELVVNLRTAQAMSVTIPTSVLLRADEVIE
jgi:putative tryptophan/tyrosine transport system substrate-binding protein